MVIVRLNGGLGNQMFQYSIGRRLSHSLGADLKLDIQGFPDQNGRQFALDCFNIDIQIADKAEIEDLRYKKKRLVDKLLGRPSKAKPTYIREKDINFCPEILNLPDGIYLEGYWQSEKYFKQIESVIRSEYKITSPLTGQNFIISQLIEATDSIGIHIRRGDYVSNDRTNKFHGTCSLDYYFRGLEYFTRYISNPHLFVFSDDPDWVKKKINFPFKVEYICNNDGNDFEDLRLMSKCRNNIIANSSFSWWGAWLNTNPEKIVIAPQYWFSEITYNDKDRLPEEWIRINNR